MKAARWEGTSRIMGSLGFPASDRSKRVILLLTSSSRSLEGPHRMLKLRHFIRKFVFTISLPISSSKRLELFQGKPLLLVSGNPLDGQKSLLGIVTVSALFINMGRFQ